MATRGKTKEQSGEMKWSVFEDTPEGEAAALDSVKDLAFVACPCGGDCVNVPTCECGPGCGCAESADVFCRTLCGGRF